MNIFHILFIVLLILYIIAQISATFDVMKEVDRNGVLPIIRAVNLYTLIVAGPAIILGIALAYRPFRDKDS